MPSQMGHNGGAANPELLGQLIDLSTFMSGSDELLDFVLGEFRSVRRADRRTDGSTGHPICLAAATPPS